MRRRPVGSGSPAAVLGSSPPTPTAGRRAGAAPRAAGAGAPKRGRSPAVAASAAGATPRRGRLASAVAAAALLLTAATTLASPACGTPRLSETPLIGLNSKTPDGLYSSTGPLLPLLLQYGAASHEMTVLLRANASDETVVSAELVPNEERSAAVLTYVSAPKVTAGGVTEEGVPLTNITFATGFEGMVGKAHYTVRVETTKALYVCHGAYSVGGFVMLVDGEVVSGDGRDGLQLPDVHALKTKALHRVDVKWHSFEEDRGAAPGVGDIQMTLTEQEGPVWLRELEWADTCPSNGYVSGRLPPTCAMGFNPAATQFAVKMSPYRVGYGQFFIRMTWPAVSLDGEAFETVLPVSIRKAAVTPCVALTESLRVNVSGGDVSLTMFNLLSPPQGADVQQVVLTYNGKSYAHKVEGTVLEQPDCAVSWTVDGGEPRASYPVTIGCDFGAAGGGLVAAIEHPDPISISMMGKAVRATPHPLPPRADRDILEADVKLERFRPWNYTVSVEAPVEAGFASLCGVPVTALGVASIRRGSAIVAAQTYVDGEGEFTALAASLTADFDSCAGQAALGETCPDASLLGVRMIPRVVAATNGDSTSAGGAGAQVVTGGGLAAWVIALIAVLASLAALLLIATILFAVARRNAESNESGASSSGPLGVPAPQSVLYSEGVVRDMYGRGPVGGPTEEAVVERELAAEDRDGLPRPPSTSFLTRGCTSDTDGASSTYTV